MDISWAFKLLAAGIGIYTVGYLMEKAQDKDRRVASPKPDTRRWYTIENTQNALDNWQIADIMAYAQTKGLSFHDALQAYCDHWNSEMLRTALT